MINCAVDQRQRAAGRLAKRKKNVWEIERKLIEDDARPILFYTRAANQRVGVVSDVSGALDYGDARFMAVALRRLRIPGQRYRADRSKGA